MFVQLAFYYQYIDQPRLPPFDSGLLHENWMELALALSIWGGLGADGTLGAVIHLSSLLNLLLEWKMKSKQTLYIIIT